MAIFGQLKTLLLVLMLGTSLAVTGCGGGGGSDDPATTPQNGGDNTGGDTGGETGFSGVEGPLDPVQTEVSNLVGGQVGSALPAPLDGTVGCVDESLIALVDAPDALLKAFAGLAEGADPATGFNAAAGDMTATLQVFASKLQSSLLILTGQSASCDGDAVAGNPFTGTPLEPLGTPLAELLAGLESVGDGSGNGTDPDLTVVVATIQPLIDNLVTAFGMLPAEVTDAPVVGAALTTVADLLNDLSSTLTPAGAYDPVGTEIAIEALLTNALNNVLLGVLPVADIDAATGQDFSTQISAGIATLVGNLGDGLGMVITPLFNDALDGALSPVLDPVEGLISQLLASGGTANPLDGLLGPLAGDGGFTLDEVLALLTAGVDGTPLADLAGEFPGGGTGTPLDDLLIITDTANNGGLDDLLGALSLLFSGDILDGILDGVLGGLL